MAAEQAYKVWLPAEPKTPDFFPGRQRCPCTHMHIHSTTATQHICVCTHTTQTCLHAHTHTHTHTYKRAHTHSLPWLFPLRKNVNARWEWSTTLFWLPETLTQEKPVCPQRVPMSGNQPVLPGAIICLNDSSTASCQPLSRGHRLEVT